MFPLSNPVRFRLRRFYQKYQLSTPLVMSSFRDVIWNSKIQYSSRTPVPIKETPRSQPHQRFCQLQNIPLYHRIHSVTSSSLLYHLLQGSPRTIQKQLPVSRSRKESTFQIQLATSSHLHSFHVSTDGLLQDTPRRSLEADSHLGRRSRSIIPSYT